MLSVVVFHLWPSRITGGFVGVDVFFVISGFLITSHLFKEGQSTGTLRLGAFYARRIRRLLPAAMLVLTATLIGVLLFAPKALWQQFTADIAASALYFVNWLLASNAVDYFAADSIESPVQHYWSLSVEEQFYLVWPLIMLVVLIATRRISAGRRRIAVSAVFSLVLVVSLVYSIIGGFVANEFTYFSTGAHAWEFAAGGLLAIAFASPLRSSHAVPTKTANRLRGLASWAGVVFILVAVFTFTGDMAFPGYIALLPVAGVLLVIWAGVPQTRLSPGFLIRARPVQFIGEVSYSLYLWHWPPIVLLPLALGHELGTVERVAILSTSILLATLTKWYVEDPARSAPWLGRRRVTFSLAFVASIFLVVATLTPYTVVAVEADRAQTALEQQAESDDPCAGAAAAMATEACPESHVVAVPDSVSSAAHDGPVEWLATHDPDPFYAYRCEDLTGTVITRCTIGSDTPTLRIAVIGDSHSQQFLRALVELAHDHNWQIQQFKQTSCRPAIQNYQSVIPRENEELCQTWKKQVIDYAAQQTDIDLIITSGAAQAYNQQYTNEDAVGSPIPVIAEAFATTWQKWLDAGIPVLAVSDVPLAPAAVPPCISESTVKDDPCAQPASIAAGPDAILMAGDLIHSPNLGVLDLYPFFCDDALCHYVVGGLITHRDANHMTATFSAGLAPYFLKAIEDLVPVSRQ
ncbi:acyltransferase family protein [soil metagenome]